MSQIAVKVENLGKKYLIGHQKSGDLRETFGQTLRKVFKRDVYQKEEFWALKDLNFEIKQGEVVGIIGRNGAGKSTLLKILSRITDPTTGRFEIDGRVSSLLEVGTGFHAELTGRENIFLNGTILGMRRGEIKRKLDEIVDFSGVENFIDTPVKHYSSGMKVRLAFSVAAHLEPEILIIDEVLAVGDAEFQKKCLGKMDEVSKAQGRTILFVSHNLAAVSQLCAKGLFLEKGHLVYNDRIEAVIKKYLGLGYEIGDPLMNRPSIGSGVVKFINAKFRVQSNLDIFQEAASRSGVLLIPFNCDLQIVLKLQSETEYKNKVYVAITIFDDNGVKACTLDNLLIDKPFLFSCDILRISCIVKRFSLNPGNYYCSLWSSDGYETIQKIERAIEFEVVSNNYLGTGKSQSLGKHGLVYFDQEWSKN